MRNRYIVMGMGMDGIGDGDGVCAENHLIKVNELELLESIVSSFSGQDFFEKWINVKGTLVHGEFICRIDFSDGDG